MLTSKQRAQLRALANDIRPIFQIGKGGINDNMTAQISDALEARELIKITVLRNADGDPRSLMEELAEKTGAEAVAAIGNKIILYRRSEENQTIFLV